MLHLRLVHGGDVDGDVLIRPLRLHLHWQYVQGLFHRYQNHRSRARPQLLKRHRCDRDHHGGGYGYCDVVNQSYRSQNFQ